MAKAKAKPDFVVVKVGHAFIKGKGKNDKPKKDSLWGVLQAGEQVVKFFGRRDGAIRFKFAESLDEALSMYGHKLAGTDSKKLKHVDLDAAAQTQLLGEDWPQPLFEKYKAVLAAGKVDARIKTVLGSVVPVASEPGPWPWPKGAVAAAQA